MRSRMQEEAKKEMLWITERKNMENKSNLIGNVSVLKDLITYQEGSVVNKEIIKKK